MGAAYSMTLAASGGTAPRTWSLASGSALLPPGLTLNATTGSISGTPTSAVTRNITVRVTDSATPAATTTRSLSITISGAPTITTTTLPGGTVGVAYSTTLVASGGTTPRTWSVFAGSLPTGLTLNTISGAITGTPTVAVASSFTIRVTDSAGATTNRNLSITVVPAIVSTAFILPSLHLSLNGGDDNGFQTNPTNAFAFDGALAVDSNSGDQLTIPSCTSGASDKHSFYGFNLNIPAGSTIRGIEVRLDARADSTASMPRMCVELSWNSGGAWTTVQQTTPTLTTTTATYILGSPTYLWGRSWTIPQLASGVFRIRITNMATLSTSRTFSLDGVAVRVTYQ